MVEAVTINPSTPSQTLEEEAAAQEAAALAAKGDTPLAGEEPKSERPEWLPEKFKTPEDMAKAYAELEKGKSGNPTDEKTQTEDEASEAATKAVENAGLDMDALATEYETDGKLSEDSMKALEKVGITSDMVDVYLSGQQAQADAARDAVLKPVGGEEAYAEMLAWASDNMEDADIDSFNAVLESGDLAATKMAVENLHTRYKAENGAEPNRQLNGNASSTGKAVYASSAELMKDMGNPEYASNPAFRAKVIDKLSRSSIM